MRRDDVESDASTPIKHKSNLRSDAKRRFIPETSWSRRSLLMIFATI